MFIKAISVSVLLAMTALPVSAQDRALFSPNNRASLEVEASKTMIEMLQTSAKSVLEAEEKIIIIRYICPHAMGVIAAMGAGTLDPREGARHFAAALIQDRADMIQQTLTGEPGFSLMGADASLSVAIGDGVSRDELAGLLDLGASFLQN